MNWQWFFLIIFFGLISVTGSFIKNDNLINSGFVMIVLILVGIGIGRLIKDKQ